MKIVIDSNIIIKNFHMKGPAFRMLEWFLHNCDATLIVPQIVISEVKNKYREMTSELFDKGNQELKDLGNLLDRELPMPLSAFEFDDLQRNYDRSLEGKLTFLKADMPGHNDIPQQDIVDRDLARHRPFRRIGKNKRDSTGYRDTLLWEVILRNIATGADLVVLVTENIKDFWDKSINGVYHHMRQDLIKRHIKADSVKVCESLDSFNREYVKPNMTLIEELRLSLDQGRYKEFSINSWIEENTPEIINYLNTRAGNPLELYYIDVDGFTVDYMEDISDLTVDSVYELVENLAVIELSLKAYVSLQFYVFGYGFYQIVEDLGVSPIDYDDHGAWLQGSIKMPIGLSLTFDLENEEVEDFSVKFLETFGWCKFCGEPYLSDGAETCSNCGR